MSAQIVGIQTSSNTYEVLATPDHGRPVTFRVERGSYRPESANYWRPKLRYGWLVRTGSGYITAHTSFNAAIVSANHRARRYVNAYSQPRTLQKVAA
jgi:hypothetical protein